MGEITAASREQDVDVAHVNKAIHHLDVVTHQNAATSEQVSTASHELNTQAERMQAAISYFHIDAPSETGSVDGAVNKLRGKAGAMRAREWGKPTGAKGRAGKSKNGGEIEQRSENVIDAEWRTAGA